MPANANWARWIHASIGKYIKDTADSIGVACIIEGIIERDDTFMSAPDRVEGRVNGPFTRELSSGYHQIDVFVNILVNSQMGDVNKNAYRLDEILGVFQNALDGAIAVYRLGTGPDDDSSLLGCLTPRPGKNDSIRLMRFGQMNTDDLRLKQGMVDARFVMYLNE